MAQGGKGLLSHQISVQQTQQSIPLILREEREEEKRGKKRRAPGERKRAACSPGKKRERKERVRGGI